MKLISKAIIAATLVAGVGMTMRASSHREALAILNEPCADNTDTYAWVSNSPHDKLYLIMDFNPLHEASTFARETADCSLSNSGVGNRRMWISWGKW